MDKHAYTISDGDDHFDDDETNSTLSSSDVLEASGEAMYSTNLKNFAKSNLADFLKEDISEPVPDELINRIVERVSEDEFKLDSIATNDELDLLENVGITQHTLDQFHDKFYDEGHTPMIIILSGLQHGNSQAVIRHKL